MSEGIRSQPSISATKAWILASRPRTLPVSVVPLVVATAFAFPHVADINWVIVLSALLCSWGIQIGTNLVNDALDFKKGADAVGRLGPKRMTQEGILSYSQVLTGGCICLLMGLVFGIPLMLAGGWPLMLILLLSVACGYLYTGGPYPLAYTGLSDVFVILFFGWVSTCAVYYLLTGYIDFPCFLAATQIGLLAIVPHAINNLRDHVSDARVNKRTFAVRFGVTAARWEITLLSALPFLLGILWLFWGTHWLFGLPFLSLPFIFRNIQAIWKNEPSPLYNGFLANSALCQLLFGCLLALGRLIA